ncbi:MAG: DUF2569 family protein, partial [Deltaproteobacteria bacterium]|nr:DUF2569 family protein [Deltaproteobacteria bacterium]
GIFETATVQQEEPKPSEPPKQQAYQDTLDVSFTEYPSPDTDKTAVDTRYKGVGGWLLFLCVSLTILGPLFGTASVLGDYSKFVSDNPDLKGVALIFVLVFLGIIAFGYYAGNSLWRIRPGAVNITKKFFITLFAITSVSSLLAVAGGEENIGRAGGAIIAQGIVTVIWYSYLNKSKRVKATYQDKDAGVSGQSSITLY